MVNIYVGSHAPRGKGLRAPEITAGLGSKPLRRGGGAKGPVVRRVAARRRVAALLDFMLVVQRPAHRREGDVVPRDLVPAEERHVEALRARFDPAVDEARAIDQLYLAEACDVIDRQQAVDRDLGAGLLPGLALGAGAGRFVE